MRRGSWTGLRQGIVAGAAVLLLAACAEEERPDKGIDPEQVDAVDPPRAGQCRDLAPVDLEQRSNAGRIVDCEDDHTAQTIHVDEFGAGADGLTWDADELGAEVYPVCSEEFNSHVGADESLALRTTLTWAWFGPSEKAWQKGARWYRCDLVGGGSESAKLQQLPAKTKRMLRGRPQDRWLVCGDGPTVDRSTKVSCDQPHDWRAVTTVVLGKPDDPYPGDEVAKSQSQDFCRSSVGAWLNYPDDYDFGFTWFHEAEWEAGNRRSICWARTED